MVENEAAGYLNFDSKHVQFFRLQRLEGLFREAGFAIEDRRGRILLCGPYADFWARVLASARVLIVSSSVFNPYSGGGITLTNLFSGWPRDKLATAHADRFEPDETICRNFYHLSADEIGWVWPLSLLAGHTRKAAPPGGEVSGGAPEPRLSRRSVVQSSAGKTVRRVLGALVCDEGLQDRVRISSGLVSWVEDFRPQLI